MDPFISITPTRDEEAFIEKTIYSAIAQNELPMKWVIVNDGSVELTGEIIKDYSKDQDS